MHRQSAEARRKGSSAALSCLFLLCTKVLSASHSVAEFFLIMSDSATPWTVACQTPLSVEFSRQERWSGLPFPYPGDLPDPGLKPESPALQAILYHLSHQEAHI